MTKLEELEGDLYREEGDAELKKRQGKKIFLSIPSSRLPHAWKEGGDFDSPEVSTPLFKRRYVRIALGVFVSLIAIGGGLFFYLYYNTRPQEVSIRIEAREEIESGETITIAIPYKNISRTPLREVEATVLFPPGTRLKEGGAEREAPARLPLALSDLEPGEERIEEFTIRLFGREGDAGKMDVTIGYRPEGVSARFTEAASKTFRIVRVPLGITWEIPDTLADGQEVDILLRYSSNSRNPFDALSLRMDFPPGFSFLDANPQPSEGEHIWDLGDIGPGASGAVALRGTITGEEGEIKTFRSSIGRYNYESKEWTQYYDSFHEIKIAVTPLLAKARLDKFGEDTITPGDQLRFAIKYQNNTPFPLKDIFVRTKVSGTILDFPSMVIGQGGVFDFTSGSIVWSAANFEQFRTLPPGGSGELSFSVNTKPTPSVKTTQDRELVVKLDTHIEASGVPEELLGTDLKHNDLAEFKVNSKVLFTGKALYTYPKLPNSGPVPPKVGRKTTYTIIWDVRNFTNNLRNAEVRASLPPNVRWEGSTDPANAPIAYTSSSGEVKWSLGNVEAGKGILNPAATVAFRISITPSQVDIGKVITLINDAVFAAEDTFTNARVNLMLPEYTTAIPDDPVKKEAGRVQP